MKNTLIKKQKITKCFAIAAIALISISSNAQKLDSKKINGFIEKTMESCSSLPGLGVAIVKDGKPILVKGYGYSNFSKSEKVKDYTSFYIASTTKSFTGLLALILESEGKINLDKSLTNYKPFKNLKNNAIFENITIRELLNHTSGIENGYITWREAYTGDKSLETLTMLLEEKTTVRTEGKTFSYDNLGYNIFTLLLKAEYGLDWQVLLKEKIFTPLQMDKTSAYISDAYKSKWKLAIPYKFAYNDSVKYVEEIIKTDNMMHSAGGMISSVKDAGNWLSFFQNKGKFNGKQVVSEKIIENALFATAKTDRERELIKDTGYGIGWRSATYKGNQIEYHTGGYPGSYSKVAMMRQNNLGIAVFANESLLGERIAFLIEEFIYDYYLEGAQFDEQVYYKKLDKLVSEIPAMQSGFANHVKKNNERPWKLSLEKKLYCGTFFNSFAGTIKIEQNSNGLIVKMGDISTIATAFKDENTIRVQFANNGSVLSFKINNNQVVSLSFEDDIFEKVQL
ncbi:beta-lactamase family protein [Flavobacterium sp. F372]|uniref:Beta-lactamase family protein n=1 Tax=Flavobacterium bernardetii TaxID=2813823 RepID=A0ABR7J0G6_9FLAO|nr:serine hydrolase domain-containing protein [Flavobacterium bernardetii]MBC5835540.1 beta-lactamase family protein [Flavobacterium bernardetii]NHF70904.1 beta-lactamase family protein [Flavobacterium bernardetii]